MTIKNSNKYASRLVDAFLKNKIIAPLPLKYTRKLKDAQKDMLVKSIPLGRMGLASELANAVGFLASDKASYITGENINVNGGLYM